MEGMVWVAGWEGVQEGRDICIHIADLSSQVALVVKNLPANARDSRDVGLIPGSGRSPGEGNGNPSSILAWRIPWTEWATYSPWDHKE